jgi:hypothetical protein
MSAGASDSSARMRHGRWLSVLGSACGWALLTGCTSSSQAPASSAGGTGGAAPGAGGTSGAGAGGTKDTAATDPLFVDLDGCFLFFGTAFPNLEAPDGGIAN